MKPWLVEKTGFFERLEGEDLALFRQVCPPRRHAKNRHVFYAGDPATSLHVIVEGQVKLLLATSGGKERILAVCGPGDFIGEAFLSMITQYQVDAVALTEAVTCPMDRDQFVRIAAERATFALIFSEILADHLFYCRKLLSTGFDPVKLRVIHALLTQARRFGTPLEEPGWFELATELTHEDIASLVAATRVSVSQAVAELRRAGLVEGGRGRYRLNLPALEAHLGSG